jgi:beta-N-acetylhexosaminidase
MRTNGVGTDALVTSRGVATVAAWFAAGLGLGLIAAVLGPLGRAGGVPDAAAAPAAAVARRAACTQAPLARRAAQVLVVGLPQVTTSLDPLAAEVLDIGVGGVFLNDGNVVDAAQVQALTGGLHAASKVPLLVTTDEESGRVSTFRALIGATSSPRTLAATTDERGVRAMARAMGAQLSDLGLNADLAPVADVDAGPWNGLIGDRSFSGDPATAAQYAEAFAIGLREGGLLPVAKHFPGHGRVTVDVHSHGARVDATLEELLATDVQPFIRLIDAGTPIVMVSHVRYDALESNLPASLSPATYRLLRDLRFHGVAMTDSIGMGAVHHRWDFPQAAVMAIAAGADAVLATDGTQAGAMRDAIVDAVRRGRLPRSRLNQAVARMLTAKGLDPAAMTCGARPKAPSMAVAAAKP